MIDLRGSSAGTQLYNKTGDIYFVQQCMGHSSPKTTELYVREKKQNTKRASYGLAVGDALGLPIQFKYRDQYPLVESMMPDMFTKLPKGTFSDDTSMTLAICDSIRKNGMININDIRQNFEEWLNNGKYTQIGFAIDIGATCGNAIEDKTGYDDEWSQGNGSLMRTLPLAFVQGITDEEIRQVSAITHAHQNCMDACVYYVRIAGDLLEGKSLKDSVRLHIPENSVYQRIRQIEKLNMSGKGKKQEYLMKHFITCH